MARAQPINFREFAGINNVGEVHRLKPSELTAALNVDVDDTRALTLRDGHGEAIAGTAGAHSLFYPYNGSPDVCLFRLGTSLYRLFPDYTTVELATGLTDGAPMAYTAAGRRIYMSDGFTRLSTDGDTSQPWGIDPPPRAHAIATAVTHGKVPAGKYRFTLTYLRDDGEESGAPETDTVELASVGGIEFTGIPVSSTPGVTMKVLYLTKPNGKDLFRAFLMPNAATTGAYYGTTRDFRSKLTTLLMCAPPAGRVLDYFNGRILMGDGNYLWYNPRPYEYERFSRLAVVPKTSAVRAIAAMDDGVFIGTDNQIDFYAGADIVGASVVTKAKYGACFGGRAYLEGSRVMRGIPGRAALMVSKRGVCALGNGGMFQNVTEGRYEYSAPQSVATVARDVGGFAQLIAVMR